MTVGLLLVTQADAEELASGTVARLLDSITAGTPAGVDAEVVLVLRGVDEPVCAALEAAHDGLRTVPVPRRTSLSACRNAGLGAARERLADDGLVVAFPDDDLWYPPGVLSRACDVLGGPGTDVLCGRYGPSDEAVLPDLGLDPGPLRRPAQVARVSSNAFFLRSWVVRAVGGFNEAVGAGAAIPAGEDLDFLLRALGAGAQVRYDPSLRLRHELRTHPHYYWASTVTVAAHAAAGTAGLRLHLVRCLLHGGRRLVRRTLPARVVVRLVLGLLRREWREVVRGWPVAPAAVGAAGHADRAEALT